MVYAKPHPSAGAIIRILIVTCYVTVVSGQNGLPDAGKLINNKPIGKGWVNLLTSLDDWKVEKECWKLSVAKGHHIQAWLSGEKTIEIVHEAGFADGNIGLQLCHERSHTTVEVKSMYVREIK